MRVVGCFLEFDGKFLLVHRHAHKIDGDTWGLPSGKVEDGESDDEAIQRELFEETGYKAEFSQFEKLGEFDFVTPRKDTITYVTYRVILDAFHEVVLEEAAHSEYKWVTVDKADRMDDLIHGLHDLFRLVNYIL